MRHRIALLLVFVLLLALGGSGVVWRMARERVARERATPNEDGCGPGSAPERTRAVDDARAHAHGVVVDEAGDAVAGAQVAAFPLTLGEPFDPAGAGVRTGADGRFRVALAGDAPAHGLLARAAGFAPRVVEPVRPGDDVRIVLARGGTLFGRVTDMAGEGVAGAQVRYVGLLDGVRVEGDTVSAADGAHRVATAPGAPARVAVSAADFAPLLVSAGPFEGERDLVLTRGGTVRATVIDGETDQPVAGVAVRLWTGQAHAAVRRVGGMEVADPFAPSLFGERISGADGVAEFVGVPSLGFHFGPGTKLGYVELRNAGSFASMAWVAMPERGATVECRIVRWPTATLVGRVVDGSGAPVSGAIVVVFTARRMSGEWAAFATNSLDDLPGTTSDEAGRYRVVTAALAGEDAKAYVCAVRSGHEAVIKEDPWAGPGIEVRSGCTTRVPDIVLSDVPVTDVEVVDRAGEPVWGAGVSFRADFVGTFTNEAGRARLLGARAERIYVRPHDHAFAVVPAAPRVRVVVDRGEPVAGRVVWQDGEPAADALVRLRHDVGCGTATRTHADGAFRFEHVPAGTCEVSAHVHHAGSYGRVNIVARAKDVLAGTTDLRLVFDRDDFVPVVTVRGTVKDLTTGKPIPRFHVKLYHNPRIVTARRVGVGRFEVGVPKGEWWFSVSAPGYVNTSFTREARPGVPLPDPEIVLQPATTVTGHIRSSVPLDGGKVELRRTEDEWFAGEGRIDAEGNYSVEGVPPGEYLARVTVGQAAMTDRAWRTVGVSAGVAEVRFDFDVEPGGVLRVSVEGFRELRGFDALGVLRIRDAQGTELVHLEGPHAMVPNTWHLPAGAYRVEIESPKVRGTRAAHVKVGNRTEIVFPH